jgi:hypothetical protein
MQEYPGRSLGLPREGFGSLASWRSRVAALILDWAVCMLIAVLLFGTGVLLDSGWRAWMVLVTYFVESTLMCVLTGSSLGQLAGRIAVVRLDRQPLGLLRSMIRAALISLALPALVVGAVRRHLADLAVGTVVVNRR